MKYRSIILAAVVTVAIVGGILFGRHMGMNFARQWAARDYSVASKNQYQSIIEQNIMKLHAADAIPAYKDMEGYLINGQIMNNAEDWNLTLVNKWNEMEAGYEPDLVEVSTGHRVDKRIADSLTEMIKDAKKAGYAIYILSSYRDMEKQISLYEDEVEKWIWQGYDKVAAEEKAGTVVAFPGTSEHQLGLAVDLVSSEHVRLDRQAENTKGYKWLVANCHKYGFILRYPNEATEITGIIYEPWHFRYVGKKAATYIMEHEITLEEYLSELSVSNT